jgi:hemerythrin superfamily protein
MSFIDKIASAIMPPESDEDRINARRVAEALSSGDDWLATVLAHHRQIEEGFAEALSASTADQRLAALRRLAVVLTGHANAEESVLYPVLADIEKGGATMAYEEQAMTKVQLGKLELIDPMSQEWTDKLEHIQGAVAHHMFEEEGQWFPKLQQDALPQVREHLNMRFREEYERYVSAPAASAFFPPETGR